MGSLKYWLRIETGRHCHLDRRDRTCTVCPHHVDKPEEVPEHLFDSFETASEAAAGDPIEDEHHAIFDCASYSYARSLFPDLFCGGVSSVGYFLSQQNCNRVAKFLTWIRHTRSNLPQSNGL